MAHQNWFKHDIDSRLVPAMGAFLLKHGAEGVGVFWTVVEEMHRSSKTKQTQANLANLSKVLQMDFPHFMLIVGSAVECGLWRWEGDLLCSERVEGERHRRDEKAKHLAEIRATAGREGGRKKTAPQANASKRKQTQAKVPRGEESRVDNTIIDNTIVCERGAATPATQDPCPISESDLAALKAEYGTGPVLFELSKARDYILATGRRYKNHTAFFRNWMRRATAAPTNGARASPALNRKPTLQDLNPGLFEEIAAYDAGRKTN